MPEGGLVTKPAHVRALSRRELDSQAVCPCGRPDCDGQLLSVPCHRNAPVFLFWQTATATLGTRCGVCGSRGPDIAVADVGPSDG